MSQYVIPFDALRMTDVANVGGKNASLGEMISQLQGAGVRVPGGFATTADAYRDFLAHQGLAQRINAELSLLDINDVTRLVSVGAQIRRWIIETPLPAALEAAIRAHYEPLAAEGDGSFAVRSSATAEDLPDASFAGQQETFLNIRGFDNLLHAIREVFASLYNDRAIAYRVHKGFTHADVALSVGIQRMVRSDKSTSGVMFTLDTESGFKNVVFITSSYGLGETIVQGAVNPDEFFVHKAMLAEGKNAVIRRNLGSKLIKMVFSESTNAGRSTRMEEVSEAERHQFSITDSDVLELAKYACIIEKHYGRAMDIEWGRDGHDGKLYILQARPETVKSQCEHSLVVEKYRLKQHGRMLASGRAIGQKIGQGPVRIISNASEMHRVQEGDVLVTDMTDPNWEPVMKRASAIVTNRGGRTCHAAIIARELGIPAIVGCGDATDVLLEGDSVTASCSEGDTGYVYRGRLEYEIVTTDMGNLPDIPVKIMMNVGNPELAFEFAQIPNAGVGLARLEFVINNMIGVHPKALLEVDQLPASMREEVLRKSRGYATPRTFFIDRLAEGVATIAASFWPKPVIVRLSDFKSNEYRKLLGGDIYEPEEENPMIGFRGASRYIAHSFRDCFELECLAMKKVRNEMGLTNVQLMVPFVRTVEEAREVVRLLDESGLRRGVDNLKLIMMCEIPSNALLAEQFLQYFDGFSIGSNDLTQLTLGLDRDSGLVAHAFDERDPAVKVLLSAAISTCNRLGKYVGICGQGPSDHADFAEWLMDEGIQTISLNPDTVVDTWLKLARHLTKPPLN
ncbi:phosphoenolpyruvate synthase [Uliginosibacterium sp. 31-16]|uniref:phosphoenolpyruvate synthase n=1 Tax=Uliginosibacterium sp. 31-16 TaxID=3068315 RepID=UPI00273D3357|nr:phosphoenolpyruvate synthase [Uliginosibacterium sp. 31-16]MDP5239458.1 phosphoenolpyruvate synthase [Uliginosibacterium sp. 31-16]